MIGQQVQAQRILRQLGAGSLGVVYEAGDTRLGRWAAPDTSMLPGALNFAEASWMASDVLDRPHGDLDHPEVLRLQLGLQTPWWAVLPGLFD